MKVFAGLVGAHALVQVACLTSAVLGITLTRGRAQAATVVVLLLSAAFASRFGGGSRRLTAPTPTAARANWVGWVLAGGAVAWAASLWARLWWLAFERPSYDWDGLYYHIPAIHEWVVAGRVGWISTFPDVPFVNYPMGVEAQTFLLHQGFGLSPLVDACNLWYWPLALFSVVVLAGRLGASGPWRWLSGAMVAGAPVLVCQGVTTYIDPASASCTMAAIAASVLLVSHDHRPAWWYVILWGAAVGLVLGSKGTGLPMGAVIVLVVAAGMAWREGWRRWTAWIPGLAAGLCVVLAVGGYWYARAAYHTGNPVHPVEVRFGARVIIPGYDPAGMMRDNQPEWLKRFPSAVRVPVSWLQLDAPIQGSAPVGGLGYIWLLAGAPSILALIVASLRRHPDIPRAELVLAVALVLVLLAVQPAAWWSRFTVWLHVLGLAALASLLTRAASASRTAVKLMAGALGLLVLGIGAWESERTLALERATGRVASEAAGPAAYETSRQFLFPGMEEEAGFRAFLAADRIARSRWSRAGTLLGGTLALPLGQRQIHLLPDQPSDEDLARLDELGVRWVLWDATDSGTVPGLLRDHALEEHVYAPSADANFHVLRLGPPSR